MGYLFENITSRQTHDMRLGVNFFSNNSMAMRSESVKSRGRDDDDEEEESVVVGRLVNDVPDNVLVEILCRLPCKLALQCKCVCKRWCSVISGSYFVSRGFLSRLEIEKKQPTTVFLFTARSLSKTFFATPGKEDGRLKDYGSETRRILLLLSQLPCLHPFGDQKQAPSVEAVHNDLLLLRYGSRPWDAIEPYRDYWICNPTTRQYLLLPRAPGLLWMKTQVGFICDPYYSQQQQVQGQGQEQVHINDKYRSRVVQILEFKEDWFDFRVQIFSSETGEWKECLVSTCWEEKVNFNFTFGRCAGVAYNGVLYWPGYGGIIGLDLFHDDRNSSTTTTSSGQVVECRYIRYNEPLDYRTIAESECRLGVCGGRLRMCQRGGGGGGGGVSLAVWELKQELVGRNNWSLMFKASLDEMTCELDPSITTLFSAERIRLLDFDPNDLDVLYLDILGDAIIKCNIRTRTLQKAKDGCPYLDDYDWPRLRAFSIVLPWWPTPMPRLPAKHARPRYLLEDTSDLSSSKISKRRRLISGWLPTVTTLYS